MAGSDNMLHSGFLSSEGKLIPRNKNLLSIHYDEDSVVANIGNVTSFNTLRLTETCHIL